MTGKPFIKTRVLVSHQFVSPLSGRKDFDEAALAFKKAVIESIRSPRLNAELSVKSAAMSGSIGEKKKNYEDTDGKTRTNNGAAPGTTEVAGGYRYKKDAKFEKGKILQLFPTRDSKASLKKTVNFGWVDDPNVVKPKKPQGRIRIRKFKVNPRTQEAIPESEVEIDTMGNPVAGQSSKQLPGQKIGQSGNLLSRAAGAAGIIVDELGKMRCPPGTPAANQFTDHMGTNCFGLTAGNLVNAVQELASKFALTDKLFKNNEGFLRSFLGAVEADQTTGSNFLGQRFLKRFTGQGRTFWDHYRGVDGEIAPGDIPEWSEVPLTEESRWFVGGMRRAQERLQLQDTRVSGLMDLLGITRNPDNSQHNADIISAFDVLRQKNMWEINVKNRPTHSEVLAEINGRLIKGFPGFSELEPSVQDSLRNKDIARYYENERALLEAALESFVMNPEHMRDIAIIDFVNVGDDEASAQPLSMEGSDWMGSQINLDPFGIMERQEALIPELQPDERLRIDVVGAATDAEAASQLSDFLVTANGHSKQLAAMVEPRAYARHIMKHEIAHTIQIAAFQKKIRESLALNGFVEAKGKDGKIRKITDIKDLTSQDVFDILASVGDGVDTEALGAVMSRLENVKFLAGSYPNMYEKDIWVLELTAELHALRDLGIIYGDDVDAALEWMDDIADGRHTDRRIRSDIETMKIVQDSYYINPGSDVGIPSESFDDLRARDVIAQREYIKQIKKSASGYSEKDIVSQMANIEGDIDVLDSRIERMTKDGIDITDVANERDFKIAQKKAFESAWKKKYGVGVPGESKKLQEKVDAMRFSESTLSPAAMEERRKALKLQSLKEKADSMSPTDLVRQMVDYELKMRQKGIVDADRALLKDESKVFRDRYKNLLAESGDTRGWPAQRRELEKNIDELLRPTKTAVVKDPKSFNNNNSAVDFGSSQRGELLKGKTQRQIDAVQMLSDTEFSSAGQLLDPGKQAMSADAITKRNERLKKLGLPIDPTSRESGSIDEQIENIIIPSMEVMDDSLIGANIEVEAIIDIDVDLETGQILENDIAHEGFVSGRVVTKKQPGLGILSDSEVVDGKKKHRVIIQATETDRGMFPHWSMDVDADDKRDQKLIMPPGKMRVVGRKEDGTIIVQIIEQKNTEDVLSSLTKDGPDGKPWSSSTHKRIEKISNEYLIKRRDGAPLRSNRPIKSVESEERSILAKREILASGGNFGEPPSDDYIDEVINAIPSEPDALGPLTNREGRKAERLTRSTKNISDIKKTLSSGANNDIEQIDMDPQVKKIISEKDPAEIIKMVEDAAVEMHAGFDKRPRARMREQELDELASGVEKKPTIVKISNALSTMRNREKRRQIREALTEENQKKTASEAALIFNELKDANLGGGKLDKLADDALLRDHGLTRSKQKSIISDNPIYKTDSAEQAVALLALGYEVEVHDDKTRKMVKNSAFQTEGELKKIAAAEAGALNLSDAEVDKYVKNYMENHDIDMCRLYEKSKNVMCSKNIGVVRANMPQSQGPTKDANSPAMRAVRSGLIEGKYVSKPGLSDDDKKRYEAITNLLKKPKTFADVSEEDKQWAFSNTEWSRVEAETTPAMMTYLKSVLGEEGIVRGSKDPDELYSTQKELKNFQVDSSMEGMLHDYLYTSKKDKEPKIKRFVDKDGNDLVVGSPEFEKVRKEFLDNAWFQGAILTSRDSQIVDGHHRWAAIKMLNDNLPEGHNRIEVQVDELQTSIFESLLLTKIFQEKMGIKGKTVGKDPFPYKDGTTTSMSKEEFDELLVDMQTNIKQLGQEIKDKNIYPIKVDDMTFKKIKVEPRSPGLKDNRDRSVSQYGMEWKPAYSEIESVEASKKWDGWDDVPLTEVDLSSIDIRPTESHLKGESIDKVVEGREAFREGYHPNLIIDVDGNMYISDGHNRVAMNRALDNNKIQARVIDLRKVEEPWKDGSPDKKNYKGYDLVEPKNPYPKPGDSGVMPTDEEISAAATQREKLVDIEKEITSTLIDASDKHGGIMIGLAYRFKSVKAMAGKINRERGDRTAQQAAEEMSDVIRYTTTFTPENYVAGARATIDDLQAAGYQLTVKNYWKSGDPYQGINIAAVHPNGTRFELQFHTPQSAVEKDKIHKDYEEYRTELDPDKRRKIYDRMVRLAEAIDIPVDDEALLTIGELREQSYEDHSSAVSAVPEMVKAGSSLSSGRTRVNKRGPIDRLFLEKGKAGTEARTFNFDTASIGKPTKIDKDEFFKIVGDVPGLHETDELISTEKLTSSRVENLNMYRASYKGKYGEKNRVFANYKAPDGRQYVIAQDEDRVEGRYYVFSGDKRLDESSSIAKLVLIMNDGKLNVHDLMSINVDEEHRKSGLAQALVEVAKADFPDSTFTTRRVVTDEGAQFARNVGRSQTGKTAPQKAGSSLSSGRSKGNLSPRSIERTTKIEERSTKAKERVTNLEKALDVLRKTGEWRGEEFGVIIANHDDFKGDAEKFDADIPPVNISKEEIEKRFGNVESLVNLAEEKLDLSKKEVVLAEHLAKTKKVRTEQNTIDIEDLTPEDFQILLDEYKQLKPEDYGDAAIHVGQAELDGGVLDPSRTVGGKDIGAVGGAGNTGALNEDQISKLKTKNDGLKGKLTSAESILKSFNDGEETYTPKDAMEAAYLNRLFGVNTTSLGAVGFEEGIEYDLTKMNSAAALSKINSELDLIKPQIKKNDETLGAIQGVGKFGFVSAYPASEGITTSGYFGRNAGSVIPKDIATYRTELEAKLRKRPQYDDVQDRTTFDRWMSSLRGSAYLVTDPSVISDDLGPSSMGEKQILGKVKPVFGVSAPVRGYNPLTSERVRQDEWGYVTSALMARAIRLEKEGKEVNIENVLAARRGEPLPSSQGLSSGADMAVGSRSIVRKGSAIENYRHEYQSRIGIHGETPESARPVSGYLVHKSHVDKKKNMVKQSGSGNHGSDAIFELEDSDVVGDGLTALGEIEVVLRPEVGSRTAYGIGESINTAHRPVMLTSNNRDDISDALTNTHGVESSQRNVDSMIHLLSAGIDKDFTKVGARRDGNGRMAPVGKMDPSTDRAHEPFEAQILGGFKKDDVEGIHYPFSRIQKLSEQEEVQDAIPEKTITAKLAKLGFTKEEIAYFYSMSNGQPLTGASVQRLKEYRAAKKIKKKYESQGIGYVKFAHPKGINIENPKTYDKLAKGNEDVEKIIIGQILSEMEVSMKTMLTKMRKNKANSMLGDPS